MEMTTILKTVNTRKDQTKKADILKVCIYTKVMCS